MKEVKETKTYRIEVRDTIDSPWKLYSSTPTELTLSLFTALIKSDDPTAPLYRIVTTVTTATETVLESNQSTKSNETETYIVQSRSVNGLWVDQYQTKETTIINGPNARLIRRREKIISK